MAQGLGPQNLRHMPLSRYDEAQRPYLEKAELLPP